MPDTPHFLPADMTAGDVTRLVIDTPLRFPHGRAWWWLFGIGLALLGLLVVSVAKLFWSGIGIFGNNNAVNWGFPILNYIWWLGIGHAGTFISALLLLIGRPWRNSLNRLAELMTLMAVCCAGIYPILHLGRPWLFYWVAPYPSTLGLWPQFRSPTAWDFFAVLAYLLVSALFLYLGAIPDFASARDRAGKRAQQWLFGLLALGWRGAATHWARWLQAYRLIAILAVPLVFAVSSGYSFLLDLGPQAGWHSTVFPPYFVAGAVFSGFALVAILACVVRRLLRFETLITTRHLDMLGRLILATGLLTAYGYVADLFMAFYSGDAQEILVTRARLGGPDAWAFWLAIACNVLALQALWWRGVRTSPRGLCAVAAAVLVGMWCERYMLVITPQTRDFMPSAWSDAYVPTFWDWSLFIGTFGLFLLPYALFIRYLPMVAAVEVKDALQQARAPSTPATDAALPGLPVEAPSREGPQAPRLFGLLAEFDSAGGLVEATHAAQAAGYRQMEAFSPFPLPELDEALQLRDRRVIWLGIAGALFGAALGFGLQVFVNLDYPLAIGGRPLIALPAFVVVTFVLSLLFAALFAFVGLLALCRLPLLHHPLFEIAAFERATDDRFLLCIYAEDARFDEVGTASWLAERALTVTEVLP
jgi:molybdopterin-containing oxidoreductase family membrane subunit